MYYVYVLSMDNKPLMPTCRFGKVRRMLKSGQAVVVNNKPFTIRLTYKTETEIVQPITIGQDPGRSNMGMSAVRSDGTCLYLSQCESRNKQIPDLMSKRKVHRQASRRGERLARKRISIQYNTLSTKLENGRKLPGCEKNLAVKDIINTEAKFNNRCREKGWLTPTATQLLRTHIHLVEEIQALLPVSDMSLEINKFAFMQLDDPERDHKDIDFQRGPLYHTGGLKAAVAMEQEDKCLLCKKKEIEHYHHIVPRSRRGSDTIDNIAGLCEECHKKVHTDQAQADKLAKKKLGLEKKYGGLSVLNQIIPTLTEKLASMFPDGHFHLTTGANTKAYREKYGLPKDHNIDAYCIAASTMDNVVPKIDVDCYTIKQFRRHDKAIIHHTTERVYSLDGKVVAKNRRKRFEQKTDSLEDWYLEMVDLYGKKKADQLRSKLKVKKSTRYYNNTKRIMPGAIFLYKGKQYVMTGQHCNGKQWRAYGCGTKDFPAKDIHILKYNTGLVYVS